MVSDHITIEDVTQIVPSLDPREFTRAHGRLIAGPDGLFFIHGWDEVQDTQQPGVGMLGGAAGAMGVAAARAALDKLAQSDDPKKVGLEMLEEVRGLPPLQQLERIAGSVHVRPDDFEQLKLGLMGRLSVTTESRGDKHTFLIPAAGRKPLKAWVKSVRR
jgi:hypothetical protein